MAQPGLTSTFCLLLSFASVAHSQCGHSSVHLGLALVVDASVFDQDSGSAQRVGDLPNLGRVRFARGILSGTVGHRRPSCYLASIDASGLYAEDKPALTVTDLAFTIPIGGHGHLSTGRQKEGVTEQMMSPSRGIAFAERAAPVTVFVPTRNDGIRLWGSIPRNHGGWTIGVFNDWLFNGLSFRANGSQASGRLFYAPSVSPDSSRFVQIAVDGRWTDDRDGTLSFKTKPENNEAPNFGNTGAFDASGAFTADAELIGSQGGLSFDVEVLPTWVAGTSSGTLTFLAYYAALSWRPRGEARPYDEQTGTLGRVRMGHHAFALELAARFSHTDLDAGAEQGGVLDIPSVSIGLYGPSSSRILFDYGFSILRKRGVTGRAQLATLRFQWELR